MDGAPYATGIAVCAGADTRHVIDAQMPQRPRKGGCLVNISRGSVIGQRALVAASVVTGCRSKYERRKCCRLLPYWTVS